MRKPAQFLVLLVLLAMLSPWPAGAVQPDEVLSDPVLEERARDLSAQLRCMVCQNQSIDDSDAELARDLRLLVRERLVAGDSNGEVIDYLVDRYGEFVLLKPRFSGRNLLLWATPALVLLLAIGTLIALMRRHSRLSTPAMLSREERQRLTKILDERE